MFGRTHRALAGHPSRDCLPHWLYRTVLPDGVILHACVWEKFVPYHRKIVVNRCNFKRFNILNSEIFLKPIRKMKYLTDHFNCFFALAKLNRSDVFETVTFKTKTSLKLRDGGFV